MSAESYIIDLSGAAVDTEIRTVAKVEGFVGDLPIVYLASQGQEFERRPGSRLVRYAMTELADDDLHFAVIRREINVELLAAGVVIIASYLARVGDQIRAEFSDDPRVKYMPLVRLSPTVIWNSSIMTKDEVVDLVVETIEAHNSTEVEQQNLRSLLALKDPRFEKPTGPPEWKGQRFIGTIVDMAQGKGYLNSRPGTKYPQILLSLTKAGQAYAKTILARRPSAASVAGASSDVDGEFIAQTGKDAQVQTWWNLLSDANMDPRQQVRLKLYSALESIVCDTPGQHTGTTLIKLAVRKVKSDFTDTYPWQRVQQMFRDLCRAEPVMLSANDPVVPLFGTEQPKIDGLADQFAIRLDARLLTILVELGGVVHEDDTWRIAAAFYNSRGQESLAETVLYFAFQKGLLTSHPESGRLLLAAPIPRSEGTES